MRRPDFARGEESGDPYILPFSLRATFLFRFERRPDERPRGSIRTKRRFCGAWLPDSSFVTTATVSLEAGNSGMELSLSRCARLMYSRCCDTPCSKSMGVLASAGATSLAPVIQCGDKVFATP